MKRLFTARALCTAVCTFLVAGCGQPRPPAPAQEQQTETAQQPASHEITESTVRVADPEGRWTFRAEADRIEFEGTQGPYSLEPARAVYEEVSKAPVHMSAKRARLDLASRRVVFEGEVVIASEGWRLEEVDRAEYDLDTGQVVATGRTK